MKVEFTIADPDCCNWSSMWILLFVMCFCFNHHLMHSIDIAIPYISPHTPTLASICIPHSACPTITHHTQCQILLSHTTYLTHHYMTHSPPTLTTHHHIFYHTPAHTYTQNWSKQQQLGTTSPVTWGHMLASQHAAAEGQDYGGKSNLWAAWVPTSCRGSPRARSLLLVRSHFIHRLTLPAGVTVVDAVVASLPTNLLSCAFYWCIVLMSSMLRSRVHAVGWCTVAVVCSDWVLQWYTHTHIVHTCVTNVIEVGCVMWRWLFCVVNSCISSLSECATLNDSPS